MEMRFPNYILPSWISKERPEILYYYNNIKNQKQHYNFYSDNECKDDSLILISKFTVLYHDKHITLTGVD